MRRLIALSICLLTLLNLSTALAAKKPNIVLIFADDQGWMDTGFQGRGYIETPNLDRLAKQGMTFTSAYASAGNCAPSRACLLSGTYTPRHDVYAVFSTIRGKKSEMRLVPIPNRNGLAESNVTLAEALKEAGYATGHFGKWHLDGPDGALPSEQGFDVTLDSFGDGVLKEGTETNKKGPPEDPKGVFTLTRKACEFMEENQERPFFCYLAHHAIHGPLQAQPETLAKFEQKEKGKLDPNAMYAGCTYDMDISVGMLLEKLDELKLTDNTLVVFTSDNGATQAAAQEPLRGNKGGYYEGGIREPFLVRWPGVTKPGSTSDVPVINVDLYPTFLAAAGAQVPAGKTLDGESLLPLLSGDAPLKREAIFWHFPGYLNTPVIRGRKLDVQTGFRSRPVTVIRKGDWKLHLFHEEWQLDGGREKIATNNAVELYNLKDDIGERNDLANAETAKRDELVDDLLAWWKAVDAKVPTEKNPRYNPGPRKAGQKSK
ncbi:sulfatase [Blastopirellula retiformator]|uniref:Arylsulfatase n=1 Tax=Blastopirellula retiformator TaxID=2527970 RepID=A0A5C5V954_9BACT|nr:sulfatase [Blastopirellula retiformator]TWT34387.1 Arylsulfatase [Blastopirellula retiformator]